MDFYLSTLVNILKTLFIKLGGYLIDLLIILTGDSRIFSLKGLRALRWWLLRKKYNQKRIYAAEKVIISSAHLSHAASAQFKGEVHFGRGVYIDYSGGITVGKHVTFSENVQVFTHNHKIDGDVNWNKNEITFSSIEIADYAWIGAGATILPSVNRIGLGAVIGAGAVLAKDADDYGVYVGNPAVKIRSRRVNHES